MHETRITPTAQINTIAISYFSRLRIQRAYSVAEASGFTPKDATVSEGEYRTTETDVCGWLATYLRANAVLSVPP